MFITDKHIGTKNKHKLLFTYKKPGLSKNRIDKFGFFIGVFRCGNKPRDIFGVVIAQWRAKDITARQAMRMLGVNKSSFYRMTANCSY